MIEFIVGFGTWIRQAEEIVLVSTHRWFEPSGFKDCLCQHYLRVLDIVLLYLCKQIGDCQFRNDIELGTQQKQAVRDGKPMELNVGGEKVTVGIDLKEPQGFKVVQGDMKEWERQQKLKYDELHPEYIGLVMTDKNRREYQQVVDRQSTERAIKLSLSQKDKESNVLKL